MSKNDRLFEMIAHEAMLGILAFASGDRKCVYVNRAAREALEVLDQAAGGEGEEDGAEPSLKLDDLFVNEDRAGLARGFKDDMLRHEGFYQDVLIRKSNGHLMIANVGIKHCEVEDESAMTLIMVQDITFQKKLQREVQAKQDEIKNAFEELLVQNQQLKELDHAKDKFLALTTHELRTPLAAIVATAEVLQMGLHESEEQKNEFIKSILDQSTHLMEIVNDILDLAKIRAGKMEFFVEEVEIQPVIMKSASNFVQMAKQAEVSVEVFEPELPVRAWVDSLRLREVIDNVVNNAIKYNRKGGSVSIRVEPKESCIRVTVTDTGQGIPDDKISNVFNEFETVGSVSKHHKGTGLGMPISKRMMQSMGGDLSLQSQVDVGTSFFIDIPTEKVLAEEFYRSRPDAWGDLAA
jgi:signal transduction histidine kinase